MGLRGINIWSIGIILLLIMIFFGTKRIRGISEDLGAAIKNFRRGLKEGDSTETTDDTDKKTQG